MPAKKTFLNLNDAAQKRIVDTALLEFARNDYQNASLSAIIKKLGLAKGSFYRYFSSKKDLYTYLIEYSTSIRYVEIEELTGKLPDRLEDLLIINFQRKLDYDKKYPLCSGFLYRAMLEMNNSELGNISKAIKSEVLAKTTQILNLYKEKKKLNLEFDMDAAAFAIWQLQIGIYEYLSIKYNIDFLKNIDEGNPVFNLRDEEILHVVKDFASIITNGITKHNHD